MSRVSDPGSAECILCGARAGQVVESIRCDDLEHLYVALAGDDVRAEFAAFRGASLGAVRCAVCDLRFFRPPFVGTARLYELLQRFPWYYLAEKPEYAFAAGHLDRDLEVLEVGCGEGAFASFLKGGRYVGLELNPRAAEGAARRGLDVRVETLRQHAARTGGRYEAVVAFQVLEHLERPRELILDAKQLLAPGGKLVLSVPAQDSYLGLGQNYALNLPPHHLSRWSHRTMQSVAQLFGLRLVALEHEPLSDLHVADFAFVRCDAALTWGPRRLVDRSPAARARALLASVLSRGVAPIVRRSKRRPPGHSLTAVYELA